MEKMTKEEQLADAYREKIRRNIKKNLGSTYRNKRTDMTYTIEGIERNTNAIPDLLKEISYKTKNIEKMKRIQKILTKIKEDYISECKKIEASNKKLSAKIWAFKKLSDNTVEKMKRLGIRDVDFLCINDYTYERKKYEKNRNKFYRVQNKLDKANAKNIIKAWDDKIKEYDKAIARAGKDIEKAGHEIKRLDKDIENKSQILKVQRNEFFKIEKEKKEKSREEIRNLIENFREKIAPLGPSETDIANKDKIKKMFHVAEERDDERINEQREIFKYENLQKTTAPSFYEAALNNLEKESKRRDFTPEEKLQYLESQLKDADNEYLGFKSALYEENDKKIEKLLKIEKGEQRPRAGITMTADAARAELITKINELRGQLNMPQIDSSEKPKQKEAPAKLSAIEIKDLKTKERKIINEIIELQKKDAKSMHNMFGKLSSWDQKYASINKPSRELWSKIEKAGADIEKAKARIEETKNEIGKAVKDIAETEAGIAKTRRNIELCKGDIKYYEAIIKEAENNIKSIKNNKDTNNLESKQQQLSVQKQRQETAKSYLRQVEQYLKDNNKELGNQTKALKEKNKDLESKKQKLEKQTKDLLDKEKNRNNLIKVYEQSEYTRVSELKYMNKTLDNSTKVSRAPDKIAKKLHELNKIREKLGKEAINDNKKNITRGRRREITKFIKDNIDKSRYTSPYLVGSIKQYNSEINQIKNSNSKSKNIKEATFERVDKLQKRIERKEQRLGKLGIRLQIQNAAERNNTNEEKKADEIKVTNKGKDIDVTR